MNRGVRLAQPAPGEVTKLLSNWQDPAVRDQLFTIIYPELKRIAAARLASERKLHSLQPTVLVHELFLKLVQKKTGDWKDRAHFLAAASASMRHYLVDVARANGAVKRGGRIDWLSLDAVQVGFTPTFEQTLLLDDLLNRLSAHDPRAAQVVELHIFGGLTFDETGKLLKITARTAKRDWDFAISWFNTSLSGNSTS